MLSTALALLIATAPAAEDFCANEGWYGDGICDEDCPQPDPDCAPTDDEAPPPVDVCETEGWYGDGICDEDCAKPDPDCDDGGDDGLDWDFCAVAGWYGDGICDADCPEPDPDCDDDDDTICSGWGWLGSACGPFTPVDPWGW